MGSTYRELRSVDVDNSWPGWWGVLEEKGINECTQDTYNRYKVLNDITLFISSMGAGSSIS